MPNYTFSGRYAKNPYVALNFGRYLALLVADEYARRCYQQRGLPKHPPPPESTFSNMALRASLALIGG
jgi:hypothetical protein